MLVLGYMEYYGMEEVEEYFVFPFISMGSGNKSSNGNSTYFFMHYQPAK